MPTIHTIDCHYIFPDFAAVYAIVNNGRIILVENNTERCVPLIRSFLEKLGLNFDRVDYLFITHAHLDHAGGTGSLSQLCPNATVCGHPKAINHLVSPEKLVRGVVDIYGQARFDSLYGAVRPIQRQRSRSMEDGEKIEWNGMEFSFLHTRGHANHHCVIVESRHSLVFTGDAFGLRYPALQTHGCFVIPTTSPTGYEPDEAIKTVERIRSLKVQTAYLTHFGSIGNSNDEIGVAARQLKDDLEYSQAAVQDAARSSFHDDELVGYCKSRLAPHFKSRVERSGMVWDLKTANLLSLDIELNAAGMAVAAGHLRRKP